MIPLRKLVKSSFSDLTRQRIRGEVNKTIASRERYRRGIKVKGPNVRRDNRDHWKPVNVNLRLVSARLVKEKPHTATLYQDGKHKVVRDRETFTHKQVQSNPYLMGFYVPPDVTRREKGAKIRAILDSL